MKLMQVYFSSTHNIASRSVLSLLSWMITSTSYAQNTTASAPPISPQEQALLSQLDGLLLPEKIGLWPPAPSVWLALFFAIVILSVSSYLILKSRKKKAYRKTAQKERLHIIKTYEQEHKKVATKSVTKTQQNTAKELLSLLKKTYFTAYPSNRSIVAGRYGTEFIALLRNNLHDKHKEQTWSKVHVNTEVLYRNEAMLTDKSALNDLTKMIEHINTFAKHWIDLHTPIKQTTDMQKGLNKVASNLKSDHKGAQNRV